MPQYRAICLECREVKFIAGSAEDLKSLIIFHHDDTKPPDREAMEQMDRGTGCSNYKVIDGTTGETIILFEMGGRLIRTGSNKEWPRETW